MWSNITTWFNYNPVVVFSKFKQEPHVPLS